MNVMIVIKSVAFVAVVSAIAFASPANAKSKRVRSETGPLIMSGSFGAQVNSRRSQSADVCVPVRIGVR
jgi:hypothetical protein